MFSYSFFLKVKEYGTPMTDQTPTDHFSFRRNVFEIIQMLIRHNSAVGDLIQLRSTISVSRESNSGRLKFPYDARSWRRTRGGERGLGGGGESWRNVLWDTKRPFLGRKSLRALSQSLTAEDLRLSKCHRSARKNLYLRSNSLSYNLPAASDRFASRGVQKVHSNRARSS